MRDVPRLRYVREARALSQRDLAATSGVAHDTIGQLERGERKARPSTVRKLAEALGVEPFVLLAETEEAAGAEKNRPRAKGDKSLADRYKQYATSRKRNVPPGGPDREKRWREWDKLRAKQRAWGSAGKWAEYYVSGQASSLPTFLIEDTKNTEDEKEMLSAQEMLRSQVEKNYLQNTLRLPSKTDAGEISLLHLKLDSGDAGEIVEIAQKAIQVAHEIVENLRKKQASFENIPDHYLEDHTTQGRIETLRTALQQFRKEALETTHELLALHAEATHRLDEAVDAMRKEGERMSVYVHQADI